MAVLSKYNTFGKRFAAAIVDGIIFMPFGYLLNYLTSFDTISFGIISALINTLAWTAYYVIGHGKYGQTLGKRLLEVKVLAIDEKKTIGYKKAFIRESVWFFTEIATIGYFAFNFFSDSFKSSFYGIDNVSFFLSLTSLLWLIAELITMLFNDKRRAVHDLMAGSVVINLSELKREELLKKHNELMAAALERKGPIE